MDSATTIPGSKKKENIPEVIFIRCIAIVLVIFGHSNIASQSTPDWFIFLRRMIYTFHIPAFIFISGFIFMYTNHDKRNINWLGFIKKKGVRILIPACVILTVGYIVRYVMSMLKGSNTETYAVEHYFKMFIYKEYLPIEFLWFSFCLFIVFLFSFVFLHIIIHRKVAFGLITTIFLFMLNITPNPIQVCYITFVAKCLVFFWLGCLFYVVISHINIICMNEVIKLCVTSLALTLLICVNIFANMDNSVAQFGSACFGILFCLCLSNIIKSFSDGIMWAIGIYSYQIFLLSWFFHRFVETVGFHKLNLQFYITFPCSFMCALVGPIIISRYIDKRFPRFKVLIGL